MFLLRFGSQGNNLIEKVRNSGAPVAKFIKELSKMSRVRNFVSAAVAVGVLSYAAIKVGPTVTRALTYHPYLYDRDGYHEKRLAQFQSAVSSGDGAYVVEAIKYDSGKST